MLKNPMYAGAYAYGRSTRVVHLEHGRKRIVRIKHRRSEDWRVLKINHHAGYIDWHTYQSNQAVIAHNDNAMGGTVRGSVKHGVGLLSGLLRCGHCGTKLHTHYPRPDGIRYTCANRVLNNDSPCTLMFGGGVADSLVVEQVLRSIQPLGLEAAIQAVENLRNSSDERVRYKELALTQARYEVARARRQYDAVDPTNRLVATELERRWNEALQVEADLLSELLAVQREHPCTLSTKVQQEILAMAEDLPRLWHHPKSPPEYKKRVLRAVLKEIVARADGDTVQLVLHWQGGAHTEVQFPKTRPGQHRYVVPTDTIELIRALARIQPDGMIASILNRMKMTTPHGKPWSTSAVCSPRNHHDIAVYSEADRLARGALTVNEVAVRLRVSPTTVLRMIRQRRISATQACANAPWILRQEEVEALQAAARRGEDPQSLDQHQLTLTIQ